MSKTALIFQSNSKNSKDILYILLVPTRNATRMLQIELWFDGDKVLKELGIQKLQKKDPRRAYVA